MSGYQSPRARVAGESLVDASVRLYGPVIVGAHALVEPHCILGHPLQAAVDALRDSGLPPSLDALYESAANAGTRIDSGAVIRSSCVIYDDVELGESCEDVERQLVRWRYHPALASEAAHWAAEQHRQVVAAANGE